MSLDEFWSIVENIHQASDGDMDKKCDLLDKELRQLPLDEVRSFQSHFDECFDRAYSWELWAAAYIIGGGCSDDKFSDFRSTLISMGRQTFERALADPESLAEIHYDPDTADHEGYQYVPTEVDRNLSGGKVFPRSRPHPEEPSGQMWDEAELSQLYPRLAREYGGSHKHRPTGLLDSQLICWALSSVFVVLLVTWQIIDIRPYPGINRDFIIFTVLFGGAAALFFFLAIRAGRRNKV